MNEHGALEAVRTFVQDDNGDVHFTLSLFLESTTNFGTWLLLRPCCVALVLSYHHIFVSLSPLLSTSLKSLPLFTFAGYP
jgi:hypothetical protein